MDAYQFKCYGETRCNSNTTSQLNVKSKEHFPKIITLLFVVNKQKYTKHKYNRYIAYCKHLENSPKKSQTSEDNFIVYGV